MSLVRIEATRGSPYWGAPETPNLYQFTCKASWQRFSRPHFIAEIWGDNTLEGQGVGLQVFFCQKHLVIHQCVVWNVLPWRVALQYLHFHEYTQYTCCLKSDKWVWFIPISCPILVAYKLKKTNSARPTTGKVAVEETATPHNCTYTVLMHFLIILPHIFKLQCYNHTWAIRLCLTVECYNIIPLI